MELKEYRLERLKAACADAGADMIVATLPANLDYLTTGYVCISQDVLARAGGRNVGGKEDVLGNGQAGEVGMDAGSIERIDLLLELRPHGDVVPVALQESRKRHAPGARAQDADGFDCIHKLTSCCVIKGVFPVVGFAADRGRPCRRR